MDYSIAHGARQEWKGCDTIPSMALFDTVRKRLWVLAFSGLIVLLTTVPFLVGWLVTPEEYHFTGLLINPIDGHSYLAKIGQGASGAWLFSLPYTSEPQQPVLIFTYHLALGHLAPANSPQTYIVVYHGARIIFGFFLLVALYETSGLLFSDEKQKRWTFLLTGTSAGLGWFVGSGTDLTVPESMTFASILVNAHFGLTHLLILLALLGTTIFAKQRGWWAVVIFTGLWLTWIQPLAAPVVGFAAVIWNFDHYLTRLRQNRQENLGLCRPKELTLDWLLGLRGLFLFSLVSLPFLGYGLWISINNPLISQWMSQNITPAPPAWQWLVGYGFLTPLTFAGAWYAYKRGGSFDRLLLVWLASQIALMLIPLPLQRRLSTGLHLPICFLAARGFWNVVYPRFCGRRWRWMPASLLVVSIPGSILLLLAGTSAVISRNPTIIMNDSQWQAMAWLRQNVTKDTIVLADEEMGVMVPAWGGGARVVYGHPFETVNAGAKREIVRRFFSGEMAAGERDSLLERFHVRYIVVQENDQTDPFLEGLEQIWSSDSVKIYEARP